MPHVLPKAKGPEKAKQTGDVADHRARKVTFTTLLPLVSPNRTQGSTTRKMLRPHPPQNRRHLDSVAVVGVHRFPTASFDQWCLADSVFSVRAKPRCTDQTRERGEVHGLSLSGLLSKLFPGLEREILSRRHAFFFEYCGLMLLGAAVLEGAGMGSGSV